MTAFFSAICKSRPQELAKSQGHALHSPAHLRLAGLVSRQTAWKHSADGAARYAGSHRPSRRREGRLLVQGQALCMHREQASAQLSRAGSAARAAQAGTCAGPEVRSHLLKHLLLGVELDLRFALTPVQQPASCTGAPAILAMQPRQALDAASCNWAGLAERCPACPACQVGRSAMVPPGLQAAGCCHLACHTDGAAHPATLTRSPTLLPAAGLRGSTWSCAALEAHSTCTHMPGAVSGGGEAAARAAGDTSERAAASDILKLCSLRVHRSTDTRSIPGCPSLGGRL